MGLNVPILRASFDALAPQAQRLAQRFYETLFADFPLFKVFFAKTDLADQQQKLVLALSVVVRSLDKPDALTNYLNRLGARHADFGVTEQDYLPVEQTLVKIMAELAGPKLWTREVDIAWRGALATVSALMCQGAAQQQGETTNTLTTITNGAGPPAVNRVLKQAVSNSTSTGATTASASIQRFAARAAERKDSPMSVDIRQQSLDAIDNGAQPTAKNDQFFGMVEFAPLTKFFIDNDGTISYLNQKGHEVFRTLSKSLGFGPEQLVGGSVERLFRVLPELKTASQNLAGHKQLRVQLAEDSIDIALIPLTDNTGRRIGTFQAWDVVTERVNAEAVQIENATNSEAVNRVLAALGSAKTVEDAVGLTLDTIREAFGWAYGSYWALDGRQRVLKFGQESGTVNSEFRRVTEGASFAEGVGLSGKAWRQRELVFVEDLGKVTDCCRAPVAQRAGVKSGVCFPIVIGGEVVGTMDFFSLVTLHPTQERLEALRNVGRLISSALENLKKQGEMVRIQNMMDNIPINVMLANRDFEIVYINPASIRTLKPLEHLLPKPIDQLLGQKIDIFHKQPEHQRRIAGDPKNLPHRAKIKLGEETLDLLVSAILDKDRNFIGPMITWAVVTNQVKLADDFERDVKGVVQIVTSSAVEMQSSSKAMAGTADETARQSQVVAAASEEATRNVETVSSAAEELSASIAEIARHVQDASKISSQAVQEATATNEKIKELGESSQQIGQVVKVITSIAQQTNLLALNATIEAARAGEAGKGFAVVANEVKELARQTAKATEEISQKIQAIQSATGVAITAIGSIGTIIGKINEISTTIAGAVEEQTAATNEISRNVAEAAKGTAEVTKNIAVVSHAANEGGKGATDILAAAEGLSQESVRLDAVTTDFLKRMRAL